MAILNKFTRIPRLSQNNEFSIALPILAVPFALLTAAISLNCTLVVFIGSGIFIFYMEYSTPCTNQRERSREKSLFFISWLSSSIVVLLIIFNIFVIELLEILLEENLLLTVLSIGSIFCLYNTRIRAKQTAQILKEFENEDIENVLDNKQNYLIRNSNTFCFLCRAYIPHRESHCLWLDCCIGAENRKLFLSGIILGMIALFYGSNLTLTTVCHPFMFYIILLPDDCNDVYYQYNLALCFVCGIYSFIIACFILFFVIKKIFINTLNIINVI